MFETFFSSDRNQNASIGQSDWRDTTCWCSMNAQWISISWCPISERGSFESVECRMEKLRWRCNWKIEKRNSRKKRQSFPRSDGFNERTQCNTKFILSISLSLSHFFACIRSHSIVLYITLYNLDNSLIASTPRSAADKTPDQKGRKEFYEKFAEFVFQRTQRFGDFIEAGFICSQGTFQSY